MVSTIFGSKVSHLTSIATCLYLIKIRLIFRIFPWGCASGFLRRIVPDAAPAHGLINGMPHIQRQLTRELLLQQENEKLNEKCESDETTTILSDGSNNNSLNNLNNNKSASLLIKRLPSIGERVL